MRSVLGSGPEVGMFACLMPLDVLFLGGVETNKNTKLFFFSPCCREEDAVNGAGV